MRPCTTIPAFDEKRYIPRISSALRRLATAASGNLGSDCYIHAAIAQGMDIVDATKDAQDFTWHALKAGFRPGMGQYIPDRLFWARDANAVRD